MSQLEHYLQQWSLGLPELLAETQTSTVYLVQRDGNPVVLKLLNATGIHDEQRGALALHYYNGQGAARLLDAGEDAHLLEYLPGDDLLPLVEAGQDNAAAQIIADVVKQLHSVTDQPLPGGLHTLRRRFRSLFQLAELTDNDTLAHGAYIAERLLQSEQRKVVLHGDMHHSNIKHSARGWLAFDPKGLYGEDSYDVANALLNPMGKPQLVNNPDRFLRHATIYADTLTIPRSRIVQYAFAHACLSIAWSLEDDDNYTVDLSAARMMEKYL